jgi:hypothetical protein
LLDSVHGGSVNRFISDEIVGTPPSGSNRRISALHSGQVISHPKAQ